MDELLHHLSLGPEAFNSQLCLLHNIRVFDGSHISLLA